MIQTICHHVSMWRQRNRRAVRGAQNDEKRTGPPEEKFAYEMLTLRQIEHNSLAWQVPSLSLTAQAFLLTIALGAGTAPLARVVSAALGVTSGLLTMQLMAKNRYMGAVELIRLRRMSGELGVPDVTYADWTSPEVPKPHWWLRIRSHILWQVGLALFVITNCGIFVIAIIRPELLA